MLIFESAKVYSDFLIASLNARSFIHQKAGIICSTSSELLLLYNVISELYVLCFYSFYWNDHYQIFSLQDVRTYFSTVLKFSANMTSKIVKVNGKSRGMHLILWRICSLFHCFNKNLSFTKVYFLNFCKNFFLVRVSGREGFCSQSNKGMSQIKKRLTEIVETEENFHFF